MNTKIFTITKKMKKYIALIAVSIENSKNLKYNTSQKKNVFFSLFPVSAKSENEEMFKRSKNLD